MLDAIPVGDGARDQVAALVVAQVDAVSERVGDRVEETPDILRAATERKRFGSAMTARTGLVALNGAISRYNLVICFWRTLASCLVRGDVLILWGGSQWRDMRIGVRPHG